MSLVTLFSDEHGLLATDQMVFSADELSRLASVCEMAQELTAAISQQSSINEATHNDAYRAGFESGLQQAKAQEEKKLQQTLLSLNEAYQHDVAEQQATCAALAVDIVRKIAGNVASHDWLAAEAITAAAQLVDQTGLTLRVHQSEYSAVSERVKSSGLFDRVVADDSVELGACSIDTRYGTIDASLDAQIKQLMSVLNAASSAHV